MSDIDLIREHVCHANRSLPAHGLVTLTWGNVSAITADRRHVAIKPSGVPYEKIVPKDVVVVDLAGKRVAGELNPSTDLETHLALYRAFPAAGAVVHTHSLRAVMFAQARREIPCLGTTHADHFAGPIPVTRQLTAEEMAEYEAATGRVIVERFRDLDPAAIPGVLVAAHAPFAWGATLAKAIDNAVAMEAVARMAIGTLAINPAAAVLEDHILRKHHERKHGAAAYYGQKPS